MSNTSGTDYDDSSENEIDVIDDSNDSRIEGFRSLNDGVDLNEREKSDDDDNEDDHFHGFDEYTPPNVNDWKWEKSYNWCDDRRKFVSDTGPTIDKIKDGKALDYFQLYYSNAVFHQIVQFTNENAATKRTADPDKNKGDWHDVTLTEMKAFYGVLLYMEIVRLDRDEMYWHTGSKHHLIRFPVAEIFTRNRFTQIRRYLHFSGNTPVPNDKLYKIRYIHDKLVSKFKDLYQLHKQVSVGEAIVPFKSRVSFKDCINDKPEKYGVKLWMLVDAVTGYCWNLDVYVGKLDTQADKTLGHGGQVVTSLAKDILSKGHVIFTDNFFTSPRLADYLLQKNTYLCGKIRASRKGYPKDLPSGRVANTLPSGSVEWRAHGDFVATLWKQDNKPVYYLTTAYPPEDEILPAKRPKKDVDYDVIPLTVQEYAKYVGGVARLDKNTRQLKSRKSMCWYRRVEERLRDIAIYNAYLLEGCFVDHRPDGSRKRDLLSFRLDLAHELITDFRQGNKVGRSETPEDEERLDGSGHLPGPTGSRDTRCVVCAKQFYVYQSKHPKCTYADNPFKRCKTTLKCLKCNVPLCVNVSKPCFVAFHTKKEYWR